LDDKCVTLRDRDTTKQQRVSIEQIIDTIKSSL